MAEPVPKKLKGRLPLAERRDSGNSTPTPSPRLPDMPDPILEDIENYDPRPPTPPSPPRTPSPFVTVNGGPPPPATPPPLDSPPRRRRRPATTASRRLSAPVSMALYEVLEIEDWSVGDNVILAAYRALALVHHPDKVPEEEKEAATAKMQKLNGAKEVLTSMVSRVQYHRTGQLPWDV